MTLKLLIANQCWLPQISKKCIVVVKLMKIKYISELFRCYFEVFFRSFFYGLSFYIMSFLYFRFSMFYRARFRHRSTHLKSECDHSKIPMAPSRKHVHEVPELCDNFKLDTIIWICRHKTVTMLLTMKINWIWFMKTSIKLSFFPNYVI